jgi:hypothetical protein
MITNPRPLATPQTRAPQPTVDLRGFFKLVEQYMYLWIKAKGPPPDGSKPKYVEDWPREKMFTAGADGEFDIITWHVRSSKVTRVSKQIEGPPIGYQVREVLKNPLAQNYNTTVFGQYRDYEVVFDIWTKGNSTANQLAIWFDQFICYFGMVQEPGFNAHGIQKFQFVERLEDTVDRTGNQEIYIRQLVYSFRLDSLLGFDSRIITSITLDIESPGVAPINLPPYNPDTSS